MEREKKRVVDLKEKSESMMETNNRLSEFIEEEANRYQNLERKFKESQKKSPTI